MNFKFVDGALRTQPHEPEESRPITVTQADIDDGRANGCSDCPIALSTNRAYPDSYVLVGIRAIIVTDHDRGSRVYDMPDEACEFVRLFDDGQRELVKPFTFTAIASP